jgi:hypothetical protein
MYLRLTTAQGEHDRLSMSMRTWTLSLVLFVTTLCGLVNARADDDRDYWRHRRYERQRHRWHEQEARRDYWRHRHHYYRRDNGVVIQLR